MKKILLTLSAVSLFAMAQDAGAPAGGDKGGADLQTAPEKVENQQAAQAPSAPVNRKLASKKKHKKNGKHKKHHKKTNN